MDSNTVIGNVSTYILKTTDPLNNDVETNISKGFSVNYNTTYGKVDTASRALAALLYNTYADTILVTNMSVNEIMAG